ncbi:hypothetical protein JQN61_12010 [Pseudomonas putida]|uniref:hypothetical protein n=1 Tax=Pseudomonas sp. TaxID=306 RepID=UPI001AF676FA|nr:hypothetical protein [Pseudomonas sp.]MDX3740691.1 hypothetical protein [Pseudomonas sp.]QRI84106.1 hypothetical protein JQN61_12010 [Pseudomonas putida]
MAAAPFLSPSNKEKGHALDTALDDWGADSGDHSDLVLYALSFWGPRFAALLLQLFATKGMFKAGKREHSQIPIFCRLGENRTRR